MGAAWTPLAQAWGSPPPNMLQPQGTLQPPSPWIRSSPQSIPPCPRMDSAPTLGRVPPTRALSQAVLCPQETGNPEVRFMQLDLASLRSVRAFASAFLRQEPHLHLLINNAGEP